MSKSFRWWNKVKGCCGSLTFLHIFINVHWLRKHQFKNVCDFSNQILHEHSIQISCMSCSVLDVCIAGCNWKIAWNVMRFSITFEIYSHLDSRTHTSIYQCALVERTRYKREKKKEPTITNASRCINANCGKMLCATRCYTWNAHSVRIESAHLTVHLSRPIAFSALAILCSHINVWQRVSAPDSSCTKCQVAPKSKFSQSICREPWQTLNNQYLLVFQLCFVFVSLPFCFVTKFSSLVFPGKRKIHSLDICKCSIINWKVKWLNLSCVCYNDEHLLAR